MIEDLKRWAGDRVKDNITCAFGDPCENEKRLIDICVEIGLSLGNMYFRHKIRYQYIRVAKGQDGLRVMSMIYWYC